MKNNTPSKKNKDKLVKRAKHSELDIIDLDNTIELGNILAGLEELGYDESQVVSGDYDAKTYYQDDVIYDEEELENIHYEEYLDEEEYYEEYADEAGEYLDGEDESIEYSAESGDYYAEDEEGFAGYSDPEDSYYEVTDLDENDQEYDEDYEEEQFLIEEKKKRKQRAEKNKNKPAIVRFFTSLSVSDYAIGGGVFVAVLLVFAILFWPKNTVVVEDGPAESELTEIGRMYAELNAPGEQGFMALTQYAMSAQDTEQEGEEETVEETSGNLVTLKCTSVEKDLKIKFVGTDEKLVTGHQFEVALVSPSGSETSLTDGDTDGIIYKNGLEGGTYQVKASPLEGLEFSENQFSVEVKGQIEYKKIDVKEEIKKTSEVNVSEEDTAANDLVDETPTNTDTVEWVESTRTPAEGGDNYTKIEKSDIEIKVESDKAADEAKINSDDSVVLLASSEKKMRADLTMEGASFVAVNGAEATVDSIIASDTERTLKTGESFKLSATAMLTDATTLSSESSSEFSFESSDKAVTTVDSDGTVKGIASGKAVITVKFKDKSATCNVTVEEAAATETAVLATLELSEKEIKLSVDDNKNISAKAVSKDGNVLESEASKFTYESSNKDVVTVNGEGNIKAVSEGTATVKVSYTKDDITVTAECSVTVTAKKDNKDDTEDKEPSGEKPDENTPLKTKAGKTVYVKLEDGNFREALYKDYEKYDEFFTESENMTWKYTGWQTIDGNVYFYDKNGNKVTGEQIIKGVKYKFTDDGVLATDKNGTLGIDVSSWNGSIDWSAVKNSGVSFVIIRCGYRGSATGALVEDSAFRGNIAGAQAAGLKVGVYFFTQAVNEVEGVEEASMVIEILKNYGIGYPVFIDTENTVSGHGRADKIDKASRTAAVKAFCQTIKNSGYSAGVYASKSWYYDNIDYSQLSNFKIWLAQYASEPSFGNHYDIWQYSAKGSVNGIKGKVDMDISYLGY